MSNPALQKSRARLYTIHVDKLDDRVPRKQPNKTGPGSPVLQNLDQRTDNNDSLYSLMNSQRIDEQVEGDQGQMIGKHRR